MILAWVKWLRACLVTITMDIFFLLLNSEVANNYWTTFVDRESSITSDTVHYYL